jgi:hypothetical protein
MAALIIALPRAVFALTPNDPDFSRQWYLNKMSVPAAWNYTQGSNDIIVAVLDTGVDMKQPELAANIWTNPKPGKPGDPSGYVNDLHGWNFVDNNNDPSPQYTAGWTEAGITHGTVIAGIIGAVGNNMSGISGINWHVKIMSLRILDSEGIGDSISAAKAIDYAVAHGARVLNFSFVTDEHNVALDEAIARAAKAGVLIVAAAGNDRDTGGDNLDKTPMYPVCSDGTGPNSNYVIGVAATDLNDQRADFSNYGTKCVDISAPGENIISTQLYNPSLAGFDSYTRAGWNGTSVASPMVSGVAALMLAANPGLSRETLAQYLLSTADPIDALNPLYRGELGVGRVNAQRAVEAALGLPVTMTAVIPTPAQSNLIPYVALGAAAGVKPEVAVFTPDGKLVSRFLAYAATFKGGVHVAAGDINGDGKAEIVTGAGTTGGPQVRIFDIKGNLISQFFAYDSKFRGGVSVAVGDIDGDGKAEIVTGAGPGGGPQVRIFSADSKVKYQFFAYNANSRTGINVAVGDVNGNGASAVAVGPATAAGSLPVEYYFLNKNDNAMELAGQITYLAPQATGGVAMVVADIGSDAYGDIALARTAASGAVTVVYSGSKPVSPFTVSGLKGMSLSALDLSGYGRSYILASPATGAGNVRMFDSTGAAVAGLNITVPFSTGASVAGFLSR